MKSVIVDHDHGRGTPDRESGQEQEATADHPSDDGTQCRSVGDRNHRDEGHNGKDPARTRPESLAEVALGSGHGVIGIGCACHCMQVSPMQRDSREQ